MNKIISIISNPLRKDTPLFIILWFLLAVTDCFTNNTFKACINVISIAFLSSYIIVLLLQILKISKNLIPLFILYIILIYDLFTLYVILIYNAVSIVDYINIIIGSNINETYEYLRTYINIKYLFYISTIFVIVTIAYLYFKKHSIHIKHKAFKYFPLIILYPLYIIANNPNYIFDTSSGKILLVIHQLTNIPPDIKLTNPQIEETTSVHPNNIVIIIGESFNKNHSSLYGYEKSTNPLLTKYMENGDLIIFDSVISPASHTIEAFQNIMSTYNDSCSLKWYECTTIAEVFNSVHYNTIWISNQKEYGFYENIPSKYAKLCKEYYFCDNQNKNTYDENIFPLLTSKKGKNIYFIHLMGQHIAFSERYPKSFDYFKDSDYKTFPIQQRQIRASYDNATLYNDYIIDSIISYFKKQESIIMYFSDHAIDLYQTDNNYYGHAKKYEYESELISKQIPFMIYLSPLYKNNFTEKSLLIKKNKNRSFNSHNLIYTIMDIAGYKFKDNNDVARYSLFCP